MITHLIQERYKYETDTDSGSFYPWGILYRLLYQNDFATPKWYKTDQLGKGSKPRKLLVIEILMKIATYSVVAVEIISIIPILSKVFLL